MLSGDQFQAFLDLCFTWPGHLFSNLAIAQENERRPELDPKGPAQRFALAVFDLEMLQVRILLKESRQLRR